MEVSPDLVQLETELRTEDLPSLKRRRAKNRRDATRNERFLKDWASKHIDGLDTGAYHLRAYREYHLEKIKANISVAEILQDAILSHLKKEDEEKEEDDHHAHHCRMLATRMGLSHLLTAARVYGQCELAQTTIDYYVDQSTLTGCGLEIKLKELGTQLAELQVLAHPLKEHPHVLMKVQNLLKDLAIFWERFEGDNPVGKTSTDYNPKPLEPSKFDRLPRIELPSFNGESGRWRSYWEKFSNALNKDPTLTDVDKLSFLL